MDPITWAEAFEKLAEAKGVQLDETHNRYTPRTATVAALAKEVGVPERTARRRLQWAEELKPHLEMKEKVKKGELSAGQVVYAISLRWNRQRRKLSEDRAANSGRQCVLINSINRET